MLRDKASLGLAAGRDQDKARDGLFQDRGLARVRMGDVDRRQGSPKGQAGQQGHRIDGVAIDDGGDRLVGRGFFRQLGGQPIGAVAKLAVSQGDDAVINGDAVGKPVADILEPIEQRSRAPRLVDGIERAIDRSGMV